MESIQSPILDTAQPDEESETLELATSWYLSTIAMDRSAAARTIAFELRRVLGER